MRLRSVLQLNARTSPESRRTAAIAGIWSVPLVVELIRVLSLGWFPTFDIGFLQLRALDVGTSRTPLVGMPSTISLATGEATFHPGPLQSWFAAPLVRLLTFSPSALLLAQVLLNLLWIFLAAWMVARSVSRISVAVIAGSVALIGLGPEVLHDPWNPHAAVLPLAVALLAMVLVVRGERRWSWIAVLSGSYAAEAHLSDLAPATIAIVVVLFIVTRSSGSRRTVVAAWSVFVACWTGPIIDQVFGRGNLLHILGAGGDGQALGWGDAWSRFVRVMMPWRLPLDRSVSAAELVAAVSPIEQLLTVLVLVGAVLAFRDRRSGSWGRAGFVALSIVGIQTMVTALTPMTLGSLFGVHVARSWWPVTWILWLCIAGAILGIVERRPVIGQRLGAVMAAVVAVMAIGLAATIERSDLRDGTWFVLTRETADALAEVLPSGAYDLETRGSPFESPLPVGVMADLARRGRDVRVVGPVTAGLLHADRRAEPGDGRDLVTMLIDDGSAMVDRPEGEPDVTVSDLVGDTTVTIEVWIG